MLLLVVHVHLQPGHENAFLDLARAMLDPSRAEPGCISYMFTQDPDDPAHIVFVEEWDDQAALDAHFATPHFQNFAQKAAEHFAGPPQLSAYDCETPRTLEV